MIRNVPGVRPNFNTAVKSRGRGFSLIEVLMTVVLLAVSLALAVPSFRDMVEKRQVTNGAEQVVAFINTAQGVSMKTNQFVTVSWTHTGANQWCIGAVSGTAPCTCGQSDPTASDFCQIDSMAYVMDNSQTGDLELMNSMVGAGEYVIDPVRGLLGTIDGQGDFVIVDAPLIARIHSPNADFRLNVVLNSTGRVVLCSEDAEHAVPGYELCPATEVPIEVLPPITTTPTSTS
mgnify:CR=1 FL=1